MKTMMEMTNSELFNVLTGGNGIMAQYELQKVIEAYRHQRKANGQSGRVDLSTMVHEYLDQMEE